MILTYSMFKINYLALSPVHAQHRKPISPIPMLGLVYLSAGKFKQRGPLSKRKRVCIYKKVDKFHNIPIATLTHSLVKIVLSDGPSDTDFDRGPSS